MIYCDHTNLLSECFYHLVLAEMSKSPINNPITAHSILSEFYFHGLFSFKAQYQTIRKHTALNSFPFNDNFLTLSALLLLHIYLLPADPMSGHWPLHRMRGWHHWWHRDSGAPAQITGVLLSRITRITPRIMIQFGKHGTSTISVCKRRMYWILFLSS